MANFSKWGGLGTLGNYLLQSVSPKPYLTGNNTNFYDNLPPFMCGRKTDSVN